MEADLGTTPVGILLSAIPKNLALPMAIRAHQSDPTSGSNIVLTSRQRLLLGLLLAVGGKSGNLDFQKILFLYYQEADSGSPYDFVPYKYGAFSFTSYADRRKLIAVGLVQDDEHHWEFTDAGKTLMEGQPDMLLASFVTGLGGLSGDKLVADTYRRFPYYAIRSEIVERVLKGDKAALARIRAERKKPQSGPLQTIGYEGHSLESYLNVLLRAGVTVLCDVRRNPMSRKYGFAKSTLSNACLRVGIRYEHLPELGIPSEQRQELDTQADYDALFAEYERDYLPSQTCALKTIQGWMEKGDRVALTCYELQPHQCHRHCVSEALEALSRNQIAARHL